MINENTRMTNEDRKDCPYRTDIGNCLPHGGFCTSVNDDRCKKHIQEALEKQIPKKPINAYRTIEGYLNEWTCPMCGITYKRKQCENIWNHHCICGQSIDWSEE